MHAVLYTHQLEPITVVDIPMWLWERLGHGEVIRLPVQEHVSLLPPGDALPAKSVMRTVLIFGETFRRGKHEALMLFTDDEENALLLQAEFLPGQRGEVRDRERSAFAVGFIKALQSYCA